MEREQPWGASAKEPEPGLAWREALRAVFALPADLSPHSFTTSELSPLWWGWGGQDARGLAGNRGRGRPGVKGIT